MENNSKRHIHLGTYGESVTCVYLQKLGFVILARNVRYKTGELDIVARKGDQLHIVEVKTVLYTIERSESFNPAWNLHPMKVRKLARTAEWHVAAIGWRGDWQIDGALVWVREHNRAARISYYPQIVG